MRLEELAHLLLAKLMRPGLAHKERIKGAAEIEARDRFSFPQKIRDPDLAGHPGTKQEDLAARFLLENAADLAVPPEGVHQPHLDQAAAAKHVLC